MRNDNKLGFANVTHFHQQLIEKLKK